MASTEQEVQKRELVIFYVLDTSGSMNDDGKIGVLNEAMRETTEVLADVARSNESAEMKIAIMAFNSGAKWVTMESGPEYLKDFIWDDLKAGGLTDLGEALKELNRKLNKNEFLRSDTGQFVPVIIFMSDGYPTDNWEKALEELNASNKFFAKSTKIAFAMGEEADKKVLSKVTGNSEAVLQTNDMEIFRHMIRFVSVTSSLINSSTTSAIKKTDPAEIIRKGMEEEQKNSNRTAEEPEVLSESPEEKSGSIWDEKIDDDWGD